MSFGNVESGNLYSKLRRNLGSRFSSLGWVSVQSLLCVSDGWLFALFCDFCDHSLLWKPANVKICHQHSSFCGNEHSRFVWKSAIVILFAHEAEIILACSVCASGTNAAYSNVWANLFGLYMTNFHRSLFVVICAQRSSKNQWIIYQVLLSQVHRLRALDLLGRFLDLGPWAVSLALSVGIFPYVLKLLQSLAKELRPLLVFIWAKILAVDSVSWLIDTTLSHQLSSCIRAP